MDRENRKKMIISPTYFVLIWLEEQIVKCSLHHELLCTGGPGLWALGLLSRWGALPPDFDRGPESRSRGHGTRGGLEVGGTRSSRKAWGCLGQRAAQSVSVRGAAVSFPVTDGGWEGVTLRGRDTKEVGNDPFPNCPQPTYAEKRVCGHLQADGGSSR